ncbi:MAG: flavin reductase family protein [Thermoflavifilum sp.]|nr:flavin reductase family protein [Thermoflavifilum sp.]MCL6514289.1 flavin reductase family protein [Alicyclobacillus sp.]
MLSLDVEQLRWQDCYKLLIGAIVPRPIAFVSTQSAAGVRNLAAFSFFNAICPKPMLVSFAPMRRPDGSKKDTLVNIEQTGEFVINVVSEDIVHHMNETAPDFPFDVDEWDYAGLTPVPSLKVRPARIAESPLQMECRLHQVLHLSEEPGGGSLVIGRVVHVHVRPDAYDRGRILPNVLRAVGRMGGDVYARTTDRFELPRPPLPEAFRTSPGDS